MKQFSFKLESVLAYRQLLEDGEKRKLKDIHTSVLEARQLIENLGNEIEDHGRTLAERTSGTIDMEHVRHLSAYLGKLRNDLTLASNLLSKLGQDWRVQVEKLMEARRRREAVQRLKTKSLMAYEKELLAVEHKLHDELSVTQFGRMDKQELPTIKSDS